MLVTRSLFLRGKQMGRAVTLKNWKGVLSRREKSMVPTEGPVYEFTTNVLHPGCTQQFMNITSAYLQDLHGMCEEANFFVTDGPGCNEVISFSKFDDFNHRDEVKRCLGLTNKRPFTSEYESALTPFLRSQETYIFLQCPWFEPKPLLHRGIFEMRMYKLRPGKYTEYVRNLLEGLDTRSELSSPAGIWLTEIGDLSRIMFLWPYSNLQERMNIRSAALQNQVWRQTLRHCSQYVEDLRNKILIPSSLFAEEDNAHRREVHS